MRFAQTPDGPLGIAQHLIAHPIGKRLQEGPFRVTSLLQLSALALQRLQALHHCVTPSQDFFQHVLNSLSWPEVGHGYRR